MVGERFEHDFCKVAEEFEGYFSVCSAANETEKQMVEELMADACGTGEKYSREDAEYIAWVYAKQWLDGRMGVERSFRTESGEQLCEWKFADGLVVTEEEFDHDLHRFRVCNGDEFLGNIYPDCIEAMEDCIRQLDQGYNPIENGWEDGYGHTCTLSGWKEQE